jgi:hypothetical protein
LTLSSINFGSEGREQGVGDILYDAAASFKYLD